jgi:hypothetical protein
MSDAIILQKTIIIIVLYLPNAAFKTMEACDASVAD